MSTDMLQTLAFLAVYLCFALYASPSLFELLAGTDLPDNVKLIIYRQFGLEWRRVSGHLNSV